MKRYARNLLAATLSVAAAGIGEGLHEDHLNNEFNNSTAAVITDTLNDNNLPYNGHASRVEIDEPVIGMFSFRLEASGLVKVMECSGYYANFDDGLAIDPRIDCVTLKNPSSPAPNPPAPTFMGGINA